MVVEGVYCRATGFDRSSFCCCQLKFSSIVGFDRVCGAGVSRGLAHTRATAPEANNDSSICPMALALAHFTSICFQGE